MAADTLQTGHNTAARERLYVVTSARKEVIKLSFLSRAKSREGVLPNLGCKLKGAGELKSPGWEGEPGCNRKCPGSQGEAGSRDGSPARSTSGHQLRSQPIPGPQHRDFPSLERS